MTDEKSNVLKFPDIHKGINRENHPNTHAIIQQEAAEGVALVKANHIHDALSAIIPMLFNNIDLAGFPLGDPDEEDPEFALKEGTFIVEAVKSLLCKHYGLYHPFQAIAENVFVIMDNEEIEIAEAINIKLKQELLSPTE